MPVLDLYKERTYSTVKLADGKEYKIPNEYTVAEVERLLELRTEQEAIEKKPVIGESEIPKQLDDFWVVVFDQILILFQHYQPDITIPYLKKNVTQNEALETLGFFHKYRHAVLRELQSNPSDQSTTEVKKKSRLAKFELRDIRRMIAYMVVNGFSLSDIRALYIDEMYTYYEELFYTLEQMGTLKEGTYDKLISRNRAYNSEDTVGQLRKQIRTSLASKNKL